jgi:hypothetical protein
MTNDDYQEILQATRKMLMQMGLGGVDERIMSDIHGSEGPFWDLMYYLKHLSEEVPLGADTQLSSVLRRFRHHVGTESGDMVEGIRVIVSEEDRRRYDLDHIDFAPNPELSEIAHELHALIEELHKGHNSNLRGEE